MEYHYQTLKIDFIEEGILLLALNRPQSMNAISYELLTEMLQFMDLVALDERVRVIILKGEGEKGFCGGLDIKEEIAGERLKGPALYTWQSQLALMLQKMRNIPQPFIALIHGAAAGGGFSFALAADMRIISPDARFSAFYANIGLGGADMGSSYFLPRLIGAGVAYDLLLTGRFMDAEEAMNLGFASACVPREELLHTALEKARLIAGKDPLAVRLTKEAINQNLDSGGLEAAVHLENRNQVLLMLNRLVDGKPLLDIKKTP